MNFLWVVIDEWRGARGASGRPRVLEASTGFCSDPMGYLLLWDLHALHERCESPVMRGARAGGTRRRCSARPRGAASRASKLAREERRNGSRAAHAVPNSKFFHTLSITSIYRSMHGALNIGKKIN